MAVSAVRPVAQRLDTRSSECGDADRSPSCSAAEKIDYLTKQVGEVGLDAVPYAPIIDSGISVDQDVAKCDDAGQIFNLSGERGIVL